MTASRHSSPRDEAAALAASITVFALVANQVGGRAVRDTLFLSHFDASHLPRMFVASSATAIFAAFVLARPLALRGPQRMASLALFASAVTLIGIFSLARTSPAAASVALYLHLAVTGTLLFSWFWTAVTERFDPRSAKRRIGTISAAATLGGVAGGLLAERVGTAFSTITLLPVLALLHVVAGVFARRIGSSDEISGTSLRPEDNAPSPRAVLDLLREPYLRSLAALVFGVAVTSVLFDFVFKARAQAAFPESAELLRFFALFYAATSVLTFVVQSLLSQRLLHRVGLANTAATLPSAAAMLGVVALIAPGFAPITAARAMESTLRSSLFRSSYELFYTPIARRVVRATKSLVDVGFDRLGEGFGALAIHGILVAGVAAPHSILLGFAVAVAVGCLLLAPRLHAGYVATLEKRLLEGGSGIDPGDAQDETTRSTILRTISVKSYRRDSDATHAPHAPVMPAPHSGAASPDSAARAAPLTLADETVARLQDLRSGDATRARRILGSSQPLDPLLVPQAIALLAWDAVSSDAARALARGVDRWTGQLADALIDPASEFAVRRRIPRVLARGTTSRAVVALVQALADARFEVRYRAAEALAGLRGRQPQIELPAAAVWAAIEREAKGGTARLAGQMLIDPVEEGSAPEVETPRDPSRAAGRALLNLLSALHPGAQFTAAFDCLRGGDPRTRGTALEYVETFLPVSMRREVMAFLEETSGRAAAAEPRMAPSVDEETLRRSQETIRTSLEEIRRLRKGEGNPS